MTENVTAEQLVTARRGEMPRSRVLGLAQRAPGLAFFSIVGAGRAVAPRRVAPSRGADTRLTRTGAVSRRSRWMAKAVGRCHACC